MIGTFYFDVCFDAIKKNLKMEEDNCINELLQKISNVGEKSKLLLEKNQEYFELWEIEEQIIKLQQNTQSLCISCQDISELHELIMKREEKITSIVNCANGDNQIASQAKVE